MLFQHLWISKEFHHGFLVVSSELSFLSKGNLMFFAVFVRPFDDIAVHGLGLLRDVQFCLVLFERLYKLVDNRSRFHRVT